MKRKLTYILIFIVGLSALLLAGTTVLHAAELKKVQISKAMTPCVPEKHEAHLAIDGLISYDSFWIGSLA